MNPALPLWNPTLDIEDLNHIMGHTSQLWEELRGQRLFITGGTGFFGHWLLESLLWANDIRNLNIQVTVLSRKPRVFCDRYTQLGNHPALSWIHGEVKSFEFPDGDYPYVIHAASEGDVKLARENPLLVFETIVKGTERVLQFASTHNVRKFLFTSSGAVYGKQPPEITHIPEDYKGAPDTTQSISAYGEGKRAAEMLCTLYSSQSGFEVKLARCFSFVGPYLPLDANYAIGNFIRDALKGRPIVINGDGTPFRSYLYAADLAIWLWTILLKGENCRPYNVGSKSALSIRELANIVAGFCSQQISVKILKQNINSLLSENYVPDTQRAEGELDLMQWLSLGDAIDRTYRWSKICGF